MGDGTVVAFLLTAEGSALAGFTLGLTDREIWGLADVGNAGQGQGVRITKWHQAFCPRCYEWRVLPVSCAGWSRRFCTREGLRWGGVE